MSSADASDPPPTQSSGTAEDRKAASALADLDAPASSAADASSANNVDHEAVSKAVSSLPANKTASSSSATTTAPGAAAKKTVKVDAADVALLVDQIEVTKARATELLKAHDGDAVAALRAVARG
ncbi:hypothetical protein BBK36DRAFT_1203169 [Trichoderma citrinoviride]|uniref:Nascent polypeptide-associated complex subunit alpha-like UBA domain-containing protein n=1 Tax=Trichoderma citrinoviride TaxID=58853 RepID=A0A2T4B9C4_9HYPO|nr:hypothetical protein BBK36DRAFT_1203169 [Trichoderma citrinoviride]PTB65933.1 hypothetical protein BBK36DRAFT_1203169 [Trichoderma citrinoviride]